MSNGDQNAAAERGEGRGGGGEGESKKGPKYCVCHAACSPNNSELIRSVRNQSLEQCAIPLSKAYRQRVRLGGLFQRPLGRGGLPPLPQGHGGLSQGHGGLSQGQGGLDFLLFARYATFRSTLAQPRSTPLPRSRYIMVRISNPRIVDGK